MTNHPSRTKVVTYCARDGDTIDLTLRQIKRLNAARVWPRSPRDGQEYCQVMHGLHPGRPTFSEDQIAAICGTPPQRVK